MPKTTLNVPEPSERSESMRPRPAPVAEDSDILDWDASIETPPPRPTGTIRVTLVAGAPGQPSPVTDPRSDH